MGTNAGRWGIALPARAGLATAVLVVAACGADRPDPEPAAEQLAEALASGDFDGVALAGASATEVESSFEEIVDGMGGAARSVELRELTPAGEDDDAWTATYDVGWNLTRDAEQADDGEAADSGRWSYSTTARLTLLDDGENSVWQAEWTPAVVHPDLEDGDRLRLRRRPAERGEILGAAGSVLVTARDVYRIGVDKTRFGDDADDEDMVATAEQVAALVDVDPGRLVDRLRATGDQAFVEAITLRKDDAGAVLDEIDDIEGAAAVADTMHLAPSREFARPVLGTVGEATEEIIEDSDGRIEAGDVVGLSGLQRRYDDRLRGTPGVDVQIVPGDGDPSTVYENAPVAGDDLELTLSPDLQAHAENVLSDVEPASAIVAIEASTGRVLAAASGPGSEGYSTATLGQYAPGSTFKVAPALALLRSGVTPDSPLECPATINVDGRQFGNYSDYPDSALGDITLETALAESCNTAFIGQAGGLPQRDVADAAASLGLGLGDGTELEYPAFLGEVPDEADGTTHAASMIGQGEIVASPLAMAAVAASVASGETVVPQLIDGDGEAGVEPPTALGEDEAAELREMMRSAVTGGSASFLQDVPGEQVGAKTGTAEYGSDSPPRTHAWMIAFQDDLAVAVFVEDGESGSGTAGPLLHEFLSTR